MVHVGRAQGQRIYFIGNGASAMMASHFAADACKNAGLSALAFNDVSLLTAIGNDVSFDEIFALPLGRLARAGDLVIAISSSGNSPNVIRALEKARSIAMQIVTLTGKGADNRARARGDLNFYVPADRYGWVECAHQLILHYWLDQYLNLHGGGAL
jgi:D-sedoheptulose 7-phosphate isomerase